MWVDAQTFITAGGVLTAVCAFIALFWKLFKWIDHQKKQDEETKRLEKKFDDEVKRLDKKTDDAEVKREKDKAAILEEQALIIYGTLACLKGLAEQGCDGAVTEAIAKIEKHINKNAHSSI